MKKVVCLSFILCLLTSISADVWAQKVINLSKTKTIENATPTPALNIEIPERDESIDIMHQIYLKQQAVKLHSITYKDGTPLKGELTHGGMRVYIENYNELSSVTLTLTYKGEGEPTEKRYSKCVIDPVPPL